MVDREEKSFLGLTPIQWPYIIFAFKGAAEMMKKSSLVDGCWWRVFSLVVD